MSVICADDARALAKDVASIPDDQLGRCWESIAGEISYLNADERGGGWRDVPRWRPSLAAIGEEIARRGLPTPDGSGFLL